MKTVLGVLVAAFLFAPAAGNATILKITATSSSVGELGYFVVDDAVIVADSDKRLVASQFEDFYFSDPGSGVTLDTGNVGADTGTTIFSMLGGVWTVTGGAGQSLTDGTLGNFFLVAGSFFARFEFPRTTYSDVSWSTATFVQVDEPGVMALFGLGLAGLGFARRRRMI
jgi:hypothetical protein